MTQPKKWPFDVWQQVAIRRFALQPSEFWAMPVRDWLGLINGAKPRGFDRVQLDELMKKYPDYGDENELG